MKSAFGPITPPVRVESFEHEMLSARHLPATMNTVVSRTLHTKLPKSLKEVSAIARAGAAIAKAKVGRQRLNVADFADKPSSFDDALQGSSARRYALDVLTHE